MTRYLVILEPTQTGFCAYSPDLPGCVSTGETRQEAETNMREAMDLHVNGLRDRGGRVPRPRTEFVQVDLAGAPAV